MDKTYTPNLNDYVSFRQHEGWVYFVDEEYITIEIGVSEKKCRLTDDLHKMNHTLLVCYKQNWDELQYIRKRKSIYHD